MSQLDPAPTSQLVVNDLVARQNAIVNNSIILLGRDGAGTLTTRFTLRVENDVLKIIKRIETGDIHTETTVFEFT